MTKKSFKEEDKKNNVKILSLDEIDALLTAISTGDESYNKNTKIKNNDRKEKRKIKKLFEDQFEKEYINKFYKETFVLYYKNTYTLYTLKNKRMDAIHLITLPQSDIDKLLKLLNTGNGGVAIC